jgi:hypothetical protein
MQQKSIVYFLLVLFALGPTAISAQLVPNDTLNLFLKKDREDTTKVKHLNMLAWNLGRENPDTGIYLAGQALQLSKKLNWPRGISNSLGRIGAF